MKEKHLFFDLDRTLWDFEKNSEIALRLLFEELGLHTLIPHFDSFHDNYKETNAHLWKEYGQGRIKKEELRSERFRRTLDNFKIKDERITEKLSSGYIELSPRQTALFPSALETLNELKSEGYQMHIITNGFKEVQFIKLEEARLKPYFDLILCSEEVGHNKPSKLIFEYALQTVSAKAENSVMIGDDYEVDVVGARNSGMHAILFDPENEKSKLENLHRIQHLNELPGLLPWVFRTLR